MICFMFPGQPMSLAAIPAADPAFRQIAALCQSVSGFNPLDDQLTGHGLCDSVRLQLFGTAMSLYRFDQLLAQHGPPHLLAEHSMGIYPALAASGAIDAETAFALTCRIGMAMAAFGTEGSYALASVIGLTCDQLTGLAGNHGVHIANHNTSRHFLLAGEEGLIRNAATEAEAAGAFSSAVFPSDAPLHTPMIRAIGAELHAIVNEYSYREPNISLVDHVEQRHLDAEQIPLFIVEELCRPVFWDATYKSLKASGIRRFYEAGAGQALTKFNRWIDSEL